MFDLLQQYSGALTLLATIILVAITGFYAYWTKGILAATASQSRLSLSPVVGVKVAKITIGPLFGPKRRNMSVELELSNVGNAPAIEVLIDAEIELRYSNIKGEKVIPARYEPDMIPFIRPGESVSGVGPNFGNTFITHFFDDVRESRRLNLHRIETDPTKESFKTSRLRVIAFCRNSLGQHFRSYYEAEIGIWKLHGEEEIPADDGSVEVSISYVPRPVFHAGVIDEKSVHDEILRRNKIRDLCGW
jgi:hypothetical protein